MCIASIKYTFMTSTSGRSVPVVLYLNLSKLMEYIKQNYFPDVVCSLFHQFSSLLLYYFGMPAIFLGARLNSSSAKCNVINNWIPTKETGDYCANPTTI